MLKKRIMSNTNKKYVTLAIHSTAQAKYWNREDGWQTVVDFMIDKGYEVHQVDWDSGEYMGNHPPKGIVDKTHLPLPETAQIIKDSECFIGISSGLSWLAWSLDVPVVMVSGFTDPNFEMDCGRVFNENVCNSCFKDEEFDAGDWNWCPRHKDTDRMFECSKEIHPYEVLNEISKILFPKSKGVDSCKVICTWMGGDRQRRDGLKNSGYRYDWPDHGQYWEKDKIFSSFKEIMTLEHSIDGGRKYDTIIVNSYSENTEMYKYLNYINGVETKNGKFRVLNLLDNEGKNYKSFNDAYKYFRDDYDWWMFTPDDYVYLSNGWYQATIDKFEEKENTAVVSLLGNGQEWKGYWDLHTTHSHDGAILSNTFYLDKLLEWFGGTFPYASGDVHTDHMDMSHVVVGEIPFTNTFQKYGYKVVSFSDTHDTQYLPDDKVEEKQDELPPEVKWPLTHNGKIYSIPYWNWKEEKYDKTNLELEDKFNNDVFIVTGYPKGEERINYMIETIKQLKKTGKEIYVASHCPIPIEIQEMIDGSIYDKRNELIDQERVLDGYTIYDRRYGSYYAVYWTTGYNDRHDQWASVKIPIPLGRHQVVCMSNIHNGLALARELGKDLAYIIESDIKLDDRDLGQFDWMKDQMRLQGKSGYVQSFTDQKFPGGRKEGIWGIGMEWAVVEPSLFLDKVDWAFGVDEYFEKAHKNGLPSAYLEEVFLHYLKDDLDKFIFDVIPEDTDKCISKVLPNTILNQQIDMKEDPRLGAVICRSEADHNVVGDPYFWFINFGTAEYEFQTIYTINDEIIYTEDWISKQSRTQVPRLLYTYCLRLQVPNENEIHKVQLIGKDGKVVVERQYDSENFIHLNGACTINCKVDTLQSLHLTYEGHDEYMAICDDGGVRHCTFHTIHSRGGSNDRWYKEHKFLYENNLETIECDDFIDFSPHEGIWIKKIYRDNKHKSIKAIQDNKIFQRCLLSNNPSLPDKFIIDIDDVEIQENTFVKIDEKDIDKFLDIYRKNKYHQQPHTIIVTSENEKLDIEILSGYEWLVIESDGYYAHIGKK